jgi:hypothetical protein
LIPDHLQKAFEALMDRAPALIFPRARALYFNKYPLDGPDTAGSLRLFIRQEDADEQIEPRIIEGVPRRMAVVKVRARSMAVVHWQQSAAADPEVLAAYLTTWGLQEQTLTAQAEPWFRDGGHQQWLHAPDGLLWHREALMPERPDETS